MSKINKAGLIVIFSVFMFDFIMMIAGIKEGKEESIVIFNLVFFFVGSVMFGVD